MDTKKCPCCKEIKDISSFTLNIARDTSKKKGTNPYCKLCEKKKWKEKTQVKIEKRLKEQHMEDEDWERIPGFTKYEASTKGRIRKFDTKILLSLKPNKKTNYVKTSLKGDDGVTKGKGIHKFIALTFIPNPENKSTVNHINKIENDNRVENLEWATMKKQMEHKFRVNYIDNMTGVKHGTSDLTDLPGEEWKIIPEWDEYEISTKGRIKYLIRRFTRKKKITRGHKGKDGYYVLNLKKEGKTFTTKISRLVAEAFIPNPENKPVVNHKNQPVTNNNVENLEWNTYSENLQHAWDTGLRNKNYIIQMDENANIIKKWDGIEKAGRTLGVCRSSITCVCKNKRGRITAGGYYWCYEKDYNKDMKFRVPYQRLKKVN